MGFHGSQRMGLQGLAAVRSRTSIPYVARAKLIAFYRYFTKAEKYNPSPNFPGVKPEDRGSSGPWITGHSVDPLAPVCQAAYQAFKTIVPEVSDINTPQGTAGVVQFIGNIDPNGRRVTTATAYLTPNVLARPNLTVAINMHVDKIVTKNVEGQGLRAVGVVVSTSPTSPSYGVCAKTEVILSAGTVGTPQLLLLSGVGPAAELEKLDIKVVHDSPAVGKNLSDHIGAGSLRFRAKPGYTWDYLRGMLSGANTLLKFLLLSKGPFTTLCVPGAAFVRSDDPDLPFSSLASPGLPVKDNSSGPGVPDIEVLWAPATVVGPGLQDPPAGSLGLTMLAINLRPESTGTITLKSKNSWDAPIIDANYFASETDLNVVVRAVRLAQRLARIEPLASMLDLRPDSADPKSIWWVGDVDPDAATDEDLKEFIRGNALPEYHPISTARMGLDPQDSVVDAELRVHGIKNLRVVDASVFPTQVTGHPCSVIIAIAEKASDMIKDTAT
ncbi:hypothetical protein EIP86_010436 [Pleurotus ostreatoroseus]|nr:hypothetical protein EIP86_010436 [Pleurotus ostreatoroseus]